MKRLEPEELGDVLRRAIDEQNMTQRLLETRACAILPALLGKPLADLCGRACRPAWRHVCAGAQRLAPQRPYDEPLPTGDDY